MNNFYKKYFFGEKKKNRNSRTLIRYRLVWQMAGLVGTVLLEYSLACQLPITEFPGQRVSVRESEVHTSQPHLSFWNFPSVPILTFFLIIINI